MCIRDSSTSTNCGFFEHARAAGTIEKADEPLVAEINSLGYRLLISCVQKAKDKASEAGSWLQRAISRNEPEVSGSGDTTRPTGKLSEAARSHLVPAGQRSSALMRPLTDEEKAIGEMIRERAVDEGNAPLIARLMHLSLIHI